jgi:hypothetical protein
VTLAALRGVEPFEVLQALGAVRRLPVPAVGSGPKVLGVFARTNAGRPLVVTVRRGDGFDWWILGAPRHDRRRAGDVRGMGGNPVSDEHDISYRDLAEAEDLADAVAAGTVTFDLSAPTPEPPPRLTDEPMVVISARVPTSTYLRIRDEATARAVPPSAIVRDWLELQQAEREPDRLVSLADVRRALAHLRGAAA